MRRQGVALAVSSWRIGAKELCIGLTSSCRQGTITDGDTVSDNRDNGHLLLSLPTRKAGQPPVESKAYQR